MFDTGSINQSQFSCSVQVLIVYLYSKVLLRIRAREPPRSFANCPFALLPLRPPSLCYNSSHSRHRQTHQAAPPSHPSHFPPGQPSSREVKRCPQTDAPPPHPDPLSTQMATRAVSYPHYAWARTFGRSAESSSKLTCPPSFHTLSRTLCGPARHALHSPRSRHLQRSQQELLPLVRRCHRLVGNRGRTSPSLRAWGGA